MTTLNLHQAAHHLKIHAGTLQKRAHAGQIPGAKIGRAWVFLETDLNEYIRQQYNKASKQEVIHTGENICYLNVKTQKTGITSSPSMDKQYTDLLGQTTKPKRKK